MVLLEEYYELQEAENVPKFWKVLHILFYIFAAGFGIWCGFTLAILRKIFDNRCFLFAKMLLNSDVDPGTIKFPKQERSRETAWSQDTPCEFYQYIMVSSFIFATIWAAFFLMCGNGGKSTTGLPQPWRIVLPSMIFNVIYFMITFVTALQIHHGTQVFCENAADFMGLKSLEECAALLLYEKERAHDIHVLLEILNKTSWATAASWFVAFLIPFMRIVFVADFTLYKISVYKMDNLNDYNEEVVRVVDYESKHVHFPEKISQENQLHED